MMLFTKAMTWQIPTRKGSLQQRAVELTVTMTSMLRSLVGLIGDIAIARPQAPGVHLGLFTDLTEIFLGLQEAVVVLVSIPAQVKTHIWNLSNYHINNSNHNSCNNNNTKVYSHQYHNDNDNYNHNNCNDSHHSHNFINCYLPPTEWIRPPP